MDEVDIQILESVKKKSGEQVTRILRTLDCRTLEVLRRRLNELESEGYVILDRKSYRGQVLASITPLGEESLEAMGREENTSRAEASP
jgi:hypothetical protein